VITHTFMTLCIHTNILLTAIVHLKLHEYTATMAKYRSTHVKDIAIM